MTKIRNTPSSSSSNICSNSSCLVNGTCITDLILFIGWMPMNLMHRSLPCLYTRAWLAMTGSDPSVFQVVHVTHTHLETHGCVLRTVATDALVLKHQGISSHSSDHCLPVSDKSIYSEWTILENKIKLLKKYYPVVQGLTYTEIKYAFLSVP